MISKLVLLALLPIFAAATFGGAFVFFYRGGYTPPPSIDVPYELITVPGSDVGTFVDAPAPLAREGLLVVDTLHANAFTEAEALVIRTRVANRGYNVEFAGGLEPLPAEIRIRLLEDRLRGADSLLVMVPQVPFSASEVALVERFVHKGGKLVMVSDPTRPYELNALAERFGVEFRPDYLYNVTDYDLNFRHIFLREFQPDQLTTGLGTVILHTAGSIDSSGRPVAFASPGTRSSLVEATQPLSPIAWGESRNVLAVADFTFMVPAHNALVDNDRLISNIADFLTTTERTFELADFPYFFGGEQGGLVDILLGRSSLWNQGAQVRSGLSIHHDIPSDIQAVEDVSRNAVFLGLYEDAPRMAQHLQAAGVRVDETIGTPFAPDTEQEGTAITVVNRNQDRYVLVLLADTPATLSDGVVRLLSGSFREDLVSDFVAVYRLPGNASTSQGSNFAINSVGGG